MSKQNSPNPLHSAQDVNNTDSRELEDTRALDTIQRNIWARINDEVNLRGIKLSIGDAYALGSVIKEVLHPQVRVYTANKQRQLLEWVEQEVVGQLWPTHCSKGFDNCDQCHNREILNGQIFEQQEQLKNKKEEL